MTRAGGDPLAHKRRRSMPTSVEATARVIELRKATWRNARYSSQWSGSLETYAFATLGDLPVGQINSADVLKMVRRLGRAGEVKRTDNSCPGG